jgi:hypothetical protein
VDVEDVLTFTDRGLTNGTTYQYYITALYSNPEGESVPSNTVSETPRFIISEFPYIEDFSIVPPAFWTRATGSLITDYFVLNPISSTNWTTESHWTIGHFLGNSTHSNGNAARFGFNTRRCWLISPEIIFTEGNDYVLSFDIAIDGNVGASDVFAVVVAIDGILWQSANTLARWDNAGSNRVLNQVSRTGENISIPIPSQYTGTVKIGFYGEANSMFLASIYVDNVKIEEKTTSDYDIVDFPDIAKLLPNFPNPFNPETTIRFNTAKAEHVTIDIFNIRGQRVKTLLNEYVNSGNHSIVWNGTNDNGQSVSSGVYFYRMKAGEYISVRRMILMK